MHLELTTIGITDYARNLFRDNAEFVAEKLLMGSRYNANGCLEWIGGTSRGYGAMTLNRHIPVPEIFTSRFQRTHRMAYIFWIGEIPTGLIVMHSCDNRRCILPIHLSVGTCKDNSQDASKKGRMIGPRGEASHTSVLTAEQVIRLRSLYKPKTRGFGSRTLARQFGVSRQSVADVLKGVTWKHLL